MQPQPSSKITYDGVGKFVEAMTTAIGLERKAEIQDFQRTIEENTTKDLQLMGLVVNMLRVKSTKTGLYGRTLITLTRPGYSKKDVQNQKNIDRLKIPNCRFGVGDNVSIYDQSEYIKGKPIVQGVLHSKLQFKLTISIEQKQDSKDADIEDKNLCICSATSQVTYTRYAKVLKELGDIGNDKSHYCSKVIRTLFEYIRFSPDIPQKDMVFQDSTLNVDQKKAIMNGLASQSVHLIHGPPGTGKTKTVCELIVQAVKKGQKVLACAGSNVAVDNIVERICRNKLVHPCRIGHPSRMLPTVYNHCLDNLISKTSSQKILKQLKHKFQQLKLKYIKGGPRKQLKEEMSNTRYEIRAQQEVAIKEVLFESNVICCTNVGASDRVFNRQLSKTRFDLVVIDQCAQAVEISCWIPILKGCRLVLAGDHLQLPPTIKSKNSKLLSYTLFDRAMKQCPVTSDLLSIQYRMNEAIMEWSSQQFYEGKLVADQTVKHHDLQGLNKLKEVKAPLMFIDTAGSKLGENLDKGDSDLTKSKYNIGQADLVKIVYEQLKNHNLKPEQIGIITPYNAQVNFIKQLLEGETVEISTVDGFQGREKQCIVISMVRSNPQKIVGFLADKRRMNVAITRARRFVCLIGDSETVSKDPVLKTLVEYFQAHGELRNAVDFQDDERVRFGMGYIDRNQTAVREQRPEKSGNQKQKKKKENSYKEKVKPGDEIIETNQEELSKLLEQIVAHDQHEQNKPVMNNLVPLRQSQQKFQRIIEGFLQSEDKFLNLQNLTAYERRCVHKVAQQLGLDHQTSQDKTTLTVRKTGEEGLKQEPGVRTAEVIKQKQAQMDRFKETTKIKLQDLLKSEKNSIDIRGLNGDERAVVKELAKELKLFFEVSKNRKVLTVCKDLEKLNEEKVDKQQTKKQDKKKKEKIQQQKEKEQQAQLLEYLDKMNEKALKNQCNYPYSECTAKIEYLGMKCNYCKLLYCTQHVLAETHGCEQQAKKQARQKFKREYEQKSGDKASAETREQLRKRIAKLEKQRQVKKQGKKQGKK